MITSWQVAKDKEPNGHWLRMHWENSNWQAPNLPDRLDNYLYQVSQWCTDNNCGRRMSYDLFRFETTSEITMFLLKWAK